jgi:hypothetical protein
MSKQIYKILIFLKRRPGLSLAEFRDYYETQHMPLCMKYMSGVQRYFRRYVELLPDPTTGEPRELDFDVITELWFDDRKTSEMVLKYGTRSQLPDEVIADEERVFDRSKTRYAAVTENETPLA